MSYEIQGKDIVVKGFHDGIADSPYDGISDMRNLDIVSIPGETSVAFNPTLTTTQTAITGATFTANSGTDVFTWAGGTSLANNTAITVSNSGGALPTGLSINTAYYIVNTTATTFQLSVDGSGNSCASGGSILNITSNGSGTNSFSTINIAQPKFISTETYKDSSSGVASISYHYYMVDTNERCWYYYNASQWIYMNNLSGENSAGTDGSGNGLVVYPGGNVGKIYLFTWRTSNIDYIQTNDGLVKSLAYLTTFGNWVRGWKPTNNTGGFSAGISHYALVSPTDGNVYFCNGSFVGSILTNAGSVFDPSIIGTFNYNESALAIPTNDIALCISQLGTNLLVGGTLNVVYSWDRKSVGYNPIFIAENNATRIVSVNTNAYIFTGQRGRIYVTNGSQAQLFKKVPDHMSGTVNPYYTWGDANFNRNQIYFGVQATTNTGTAINQYGGTWAIDLDTKAIRLVTEQSYGSYAGITTAITPLSGNNTSDGFGLLMGWYTSSNTTGGVDKSSSVPYTGGQSYVDSDLIPIGTFLSPFTPSQVEWKTSVPIGANGTSETVAIYYRLNFNDSYTLIGSTSSATGLLAGGTPSFSDMYQANFQKAQWLQLRAVLTSNVTTPTYCRLRELRIRDYPSTK